ncbi:radical SAM protein, partial [Suilimivivens sp.]
MKPLVVMIKPASGQCNMKCDYCFYGDEMEHRDQASFGFMTEETLKAVIRKTMLRAEGGIYYVFQGGEPTLRGLPFFHRVMELQRQYNKKGVMVYNSIQTNGYLLDDAWCHFFAENRFLVGISLDGVKRTHDASRHGKEGSPSFDRILGAIRLLEKCGAEYNILTVVTKQVAESIGEIYTFYKKQGFRFQQY